jgi:hypothetical protein
VVPDPGAAWPGGEDRGNSPRFVVLLIRAFWGTAISGSSPDG